jgi:Flp pilus assembly protein TadG
MTAPLLRLTARIGAPGRFLRESKAMAAVEFALLLPVMLTLYLGTAEVCRMISVDRKMTLLARTLSDLTSQSSTVADADMTTIWNAAAAVIAPLPTDRLVMRVSSVTITGTSATPAAGNPATVCWSSNKYFAADLAAVLPPRPRSQVISTADLPVGLRLPGTSVIWAEVSYDLAPITTYIFKVNKTLTDAIFMRPRLTQFVSRTGTGQTNNGLPNPTTGPC